MRSSPTAQPSNDIIEQLFAFVKGQFQRLPQTTRISHRQSRSARRCTARLCRRDTRCTKIISRDTKRFILRTTFLPLLRLPGINRQCQARGAPGGLGLDKAIQWETAGKAKPTAPPEHGARSAGGAAAGGGGGEARCTAQRFPEPPAGAAGREGAGENPAGGTAPESAAGLRLSDKKRSGRRRTRAKKPPPRSEKKAALPPLRRGLEQAVPEAPKGA